ncbi:nucleotidyltransferase domain-containing protein [Duganella sp. BuS-21]|uniref:nucleotidyltransferase domain-containing protein n=1 Tax=Duganella sp. BuS-21 TaxID=2943848 RepID=UPI0035A5B26D
MVAAIATVLASFPQVEQAILHGSRARGDFRLGSDIDLCLDGNGLSLSLLFKIEHALDKLLLPYKIDLAVRDQIDNPELLAQIEQLGASFYRRSKE